MIRFLDDLKSVLEQSLCFFLTGWKRFAQFLLCWTRAVTILVRFAVTSICDGIVALSNAIDGWEPVTPGIFSFDDPVEELERVSRRGNF